MPTDAIQAETVITLVFLYIFLWLFTSVLANIMEMENLHFFPFVFN